MSKRIPAKKKTDACKANLRAVNDTLDLLSGKWKISIIVSLTYGKKRFMELQREVEGVGSKMLSKELREMEINELVKRTVYDTKPVTVEYELTPYGTTLQGIIKEMVRWGLEHRKKITGKTTAEMEELKAELSIQ